MDKGQKIEQLLKGVDQESEEYRKTKFYLEKRARPGQVKTVQVRVKRVEKEIDGELKVFEYDYGLPIKDGKVKLTAGKCPCEICGHKWMWQCMESDCQCCTSTCT